MELTKEIFENRYYKNLDSLRNIAKDYKIAHSTLSYKIKTEWNLTLRTKNEAARVAHAKNRKNTSGIKNGRFINDGVDAKTRAKIKQYNISVEEYLELRAAQENKCKICKRSENENGKALAIDHCHITNKVRVLLCDKCNRGLGFFNDDIDLLLESIKYLL